MKEFRQEPTAEGLLAEKEAHETEQVIKDYKNAVNNFINPARAGIGLPKKIVDKY